MDIKLEILKNKQGWIVYCGEPQIALDKFRIKYFIPTEISMTANPDINAVKFVPVLPLPMKGHVWVR
jgi:hypothetical protein